MLTLETGSIITKLTSMFWYHFAIIMVPLELPQMISHLEIWNKELDSTWRAITDSDVCVLEMGQV